MKPENNPVSYTHLDVYKRQHKMTNKIHKNTTFKKSPNNNNAPT